jgi:hypothetical protein
MQSHLEKVLITELILVGLLILLLIISTSKKAWAGVVLSILGIIGFGYGSLRAYSILYTPCDTVIGTTAGYSSTSKSGGSIKFYFTYLEKRHDESSKAYENVDKVVTRDGKYKVYVCRKYPSFNEIDFYSSLDENQRTSD